MPSIYDLKPRFQALLRPITRGLANKGVSANQVTLAALFLSGAVGACIAFFPASRWPLLMAPLFLFVRMALNAIDGMLAREETMSTYLGNGVSIPHGQFENRSHIHQTGISVLQIPQGVEWEDGEKAYLIIGIAAAADEHVGVLANLAEVIEDEAMTEALINTTDPALILTELGKEQIEEI